MEVVYIDVLILTNFIFHLIALYLTAQITKNSFQLIHCLLSAFASAAICAWALIWCQNLFLLLLISLVSIFSMTYLTYKPKQLSTFLRLAIILSATLFLCGTATFYLLLSAINHYGISAADSSDAKILLFTTISAITGIIIALANRIFRKETDKKEVFVTVKFANKRVSFLSLADTGCMVKDPIDGKYVLFMPNKEGKKLFEENDYRILTNTNIDQISDLSQQLQQRIRIVPCQTIMGGSLLMCAHMDEIIIDGNVKNILITLRADKNSGLGICPAGIL